MDLLKIFSPQDYILSGIILVAIAIYSFLGLNRLYKSIFGIFLGFSIFALLNFAYISFETNNLDFLGGIKDFMIKNKINILNFTFYVIPALSVLISFNNRFHFTRETSHKFFKLLRIIIFSPFLIIFYISIIICSLENKFIFTLDKAFVDSLHSSVFGNLMIYFSGKSIIFDFIFKNQFFISSIGFIFVLYILTIGGLMRKLVFLLKEKFTPQSKSKQTEINNILAQASNNLPK